MDLGILCYINSFLQFVYDNVHHNFMLFDFAYGTAMCVSVAVDVWTICYVIIWEVLC